jgi:hypothetical protein
MINVTRAWMGAAMLLLPIPLAAVAQSDTQTAPVAGAGGGRAKAAMTLQEFQARQERKLLAADTDGDSRISRTEFLAGATSGRGDPAKRFAKLDRNGDGQVDKAEIDTMLERRFQRLDTTGDGVVNPQERAAAKGKGKGKAKAGQGNPES